MVVSNYCYSIWGHWLNSCQGLNFIWGFFSPSAKITAQLWIIATLDFQSKGLMKFVSLQIVKFACLVTSAHMQYHSSDTHQKYLECLLKHHILKEAQLMTWERSKTKIDKCGNTTDRKVCTVCIVIFDQQILVGKREKNFWRNNNARKEATCKEKCVKNGSVNETTDTTKRKGVLKDTYLFHCLFFFVKMKKQLLVFMVILTFLTPKETTIYFFNKVKADHENQRNDCQSKKSLIVKQILLVSTKGNVWRRVWRIWILILVVG